MVTGTDSLGLPPKLREYVDSFASVSDPKLRYQQLLFFAQQLPPMDAALKTEENRVHGCTSVVHVNVYLDDNGHVCLEGDSDAQLTKGLLALLVNGLSGVPPENLQTIDPAFITVSGLAVSLTPSRNNGFVSMLAKIKQQVADLVSERQGNSSVIEEGKDEENEETDMMDPSRPIYSAIMQKLSALKPESLNVIDNSAAHAGHAGSKGLNGESHFAVQIVAEAFEGLKLVQRHRLIYTLLNEEMSNGYIHALEIQARTPAEI